MVRHDPVAFPGPKKIGIFLFSVFFAGACFYHFQEAEGFARMLPEFVPLRIPLIYATGILELVLAVNALGIDPESYAVSLHTAAEGDAANRPDGVVLDYTSDGQDTLHVSLWPDKTTVRFD
ncbi:hypothetical protein YDYSY3_32630 [Paenibacillus chitinolyticus]|uniref:hypothetical protein n=1 Tax=Paenibacillus chitinolyticus TaxID=79263 RepID=UPI0026E4D9D8|nr:hypothetical protein [Paenibacillus chitinolyticus]GKS12263.1 hypothetical protein YDYSY3_32630 [Paenibacillus chitinolyticus]